MSIILKFNENVCVFCKYDKNSPFVFKKIQEIIHDKLPQIRLEHVGSSAIGVGGKGIIDVLVVSSPQKYKLVSKKLILLGFQKDLVKKTKRKTILFQGAIKYRNKKYYIHCHMTNSNSSDYYNMINFRDRLLKSKTLLKEYAKIKNEAIGKGKFENCDYNAHKQPFIRKILTMNKPPHNEFFTFLNNSKTPLFTNNRGFFILNKGAFVCK